MADLEFIGKAFKVVPATTPAVALTIMSTFPTIANAGVKLFKDNNDGTISQVGQGVVIDTSINTPQGPTVLLPLAGSGKYGVAFQGQAAAVDITGTRVEFMLRTADGTMVEDFDGARESASVAVTINGSGFIVTDDMAGVA